MAEFDAPRSSGRLINVLLAVVAVIFIGLAIALALKPEFFSLGSSRVVDAVSISPQEAVVEGAQWRVVSQWQGSGEFQEEGGFYLVEFKPIPGWDAPAAVVLRKGAPVARVDGVYRPVTFAVQTLFSLAGASTMAHRLAPELAEFYLRHIGANEVRKLPGKTSDELTLQGIFYSTKEIKIIHIAGKGTPSGFTALKEGGCDIAMAAQRASVATVGNLAEKITTPENEFPIALDAVSVVVNRGNPAQASGLTVDQVRRIFSGEITSWSQLGGEPLPIKVVILRDSFGTRTFFEEKFMAGTAFASTAREVDVHAQVADVVAQDPQAIGFCSLAFVNQSREVPIKLSDDAVPVAPSPRAIRSRVYPVFRDLYLYLRPDSKNVYARDFAMVCASPAGQEVVRRFGFVGVRDEAEAAEPVSVAAPRVESAEVEHAVVNASLPSEVEPAAINASETKPEEAQESVESKAPRETVVPEALPELVQLDGEVVPTATRRKVYGAFRDAVLGAEHLPLVFHFELASSVLSKQGLKDLDRALEMMRASERQGKKMIVVGFSDSYGNYLSNLEISLKRAEALTSILRSRGGEVAAVVGAGEELPLVSNGKRIGREQNRRVEIWVK